MAARNRRWGKLFLVVKLQQTISEPAANLEENCVAANQKLISSKTAR